MSFEDGSNEWINPPPPGTLEDDCQNSKKKFPSSNNYNLMKDVKHSESSNHLYENRNVNRSRSRSRERYLKHSSDRYGKGYSRDRRYRSRSGSRKRYSDDKYYHRSRRNRYSRSRSHSHSRRHKKSYSSSRSPSDKRRSIHSRSSSSNSQSDKDSSSRYEKYKINLHKRSVKNISEELDDDQESVQENTFKNDGSFLEMFKKMQEQQQAQGETKEEDCQAGTSEVKKLPICGKRRGGRILKTGIVQKVKNSNELEEDPKDAWSVYMKEVRKYKEACCDDDSKTRPLVK